jgi:hypothetical protein
VAPYFFAFPFSQSFVLIRLDGPCHPLSYFEGVRVMKQKGFGKFNVAAKWQRKLKGDSPKEPWYILTNLGSLPSAINAYKRRFSIEEMFRDFKAGGYDLEGTNLEGQHLTALVLLIAIAYTIAGMNGKQIKQMGIQKYVGRVKESGRIEPRHSHFYSSRHTC